ncbi:MAG: formyltetrahydrofolate deformylase [Kordiimonas sp.]|nr:formyltetrahydrofolate deformylase [Kordiimonas sp.]|tara:strand:- start:1312 stop:2163 length:852 start_codon:yes stop_codon:yes gene_type:complete
MSDYILTISCDDKMGLVAAISGFLTERGCFVKESAQYGDPITNQFFMRVVFEARERQVTLAQLIQDFTPVGERFAMEWHIYDSAIKTRVLLMVSRFGHCLNDLLYRWRSGFLPVDIVGIVSNHTDFEQVAVWHELPFYHLPVTKETKGVQEEKLLNIIDEHDVDLVVLARYMQVLSEQMCDKLQDRVINIHHSFLPGFKGAKPYHQAHARGVKIIGATAHFVTADLDEGPIIEQAVEHVDHTYGPEDMVHRGQDTECRVLARAVQYFAQHRVLRNGIKTVVFK